ncbi:7863_t:CDS:2 [Acaulospora morrowiae]|uniref:7863_t:CDS:1 n=1 Tax=Acaulospora morrowiae TaxID=94023 RepID=A0A9N8VGF2_9GLOM|nr:7863_t:CDS:2 [Acaulospora morrowiae]
MDEKLWKSVSQNYMQLLEDKDTCDVSIAVGSGDDIRTFKVHSLILRAQTPYFHTALSAQWEKRKNGQIVLEKPNVSPTIFNDILLYMYSSQINLSGKPIQHILDILSAADELILPALTEYVQNYLTQNKVSLVQQHPVEVLKTPFQNDAWKKLQNYCISTICAQPWMLFESPLFYHLDSSILLAILQKDELQMEEADIWYRVILWGTMQDELLPDDVADWKQRDFDSLGSVIQKFLPHIRFFQMSAEEFDSKVSPYRPIFPDDLYEDILWNFIKPDRPKKNQVLPKRHHPYTRGNIVISYRTVEDGS